MATEQHRAAARRDVGKAQEGARERTVARADGR